jgi:UDP-MurNAc hydroxylase
MKMTWHSSACVSYESKGTRVLFDPWLESKAFLGSWSQWPPAENTKENILAIKFDYLIYTHFHSDHFDQKFLSLYLKAMVDFNHKPIILVAESSWVQLSGSILNIAKDRAEVRVLKSGQKMNLNSDGFAVSLFCSDHCDPLSCGKVIPCFSNNPKFRAIDSVALIEDKQTRIANFNDAVSSNLDIHLEKLGIKVDLVMGVFSAAGSFPQCQLDLSQTEITALKTNFIANALKRLSLTADRLGAKFIFPFAGQYILIGDKSKLNENRAVITAAEAKIKLMELTDKQVISLNPNESIEFYKGEISSMGQPYIEPSEYFRNNYLKGYENEKYFYEKRDLESIDLHDLGKNLEIASRKISKNLFEDLNYTISLRATNSDFRWDLNFQKNLNWGRGLDQLENYCEIYLDLRLLDGCVRKSSSYGGFTSMHWNQAHIGSHLKFKQSNYNATAHYLLNFLHT